MEFVPVSEANIAQAGYIHAESWTESHRGFCPAEFVRRHTPEAQAEYLRRELAAGKQIYMLLAPRPVGNPLQKERFFSLSANIVPLPFCLLPADLGKLENRQENGRHNNTD